MRMWRAGIAVILGIFVFSAAITEETPKITIRTVMKEAHKKPSELLKKVVLGSATEQDRERLSMLYQAMSKLEPPRGETGSWKDKTAALVAASEAAVQGKPDAGKLLTHASNCKACHEAHK